ncbi:hypothetical protein Tco_1133715 [Tanacetum coccineum]
MSDMERVDMGSQAEASSSSKRDMGSYISTMKPSDVKALTRKYKIPRDLHPVAVSSEWTMDRLIRCYIGLYEQYFEFAGLREAGAFLSDGLAILGNFLTLRPLVQDPDPLFVEHLVIIFLPLFFSPVRCAVRGKTDLTTKGEPQILDRMATRIRKAQAAAKRIGREEQGVRRCRGEDVVSLTQAQGDNCLRFCHDLIYHTRPCEEHHDEHSGVLGHRDGNFDDDVDEEVDL